MSTFERLTPPHIENFVKKHAYESRFYKYKIRVIDLYKNIKKIGIKYKMFPF